MLDDRNLLLSFLGNFFAMIRRDELQRVAGSLIKSVNYRNLDHLNEKWIGQLIRANYLPGPAYREPTQRGWSVAKIFALWVL